MAIGGILGTKALGIVLIGLLGLNSFASTWGGVFSSPPKIFSDATSEWQECEIVLTEKEKNYIFPREGISNPTEPEEKVKIKYRERDGNLEIEYDGQRAIDIERVFEIIAKHEKQKSYWWNKLIPFKNRKDN